MARFRTIDPKLWQHPFFRKQPWYVRDVFIFLFSSHADDEGRFVADSFAILEGAFSRNHPVTEDDVEQALAALEEGQLIIRYDDYGFLLGWYEHQFIDRRYRQPSSLPPPPVAVNSWDTAEAVRREYAKKYNYAFGRVPFYAALNNIEPSSVDYGVGWHTYKRETVRALDGHRCQRCGRPGGEDIKLHVHHILPASQGGSNDISNLVTLCASCHKTVHHHGIDFPLPRRCEVTVNGQDLGKDIQASSQQRQPK